jgi:ATP-binding cassette, subfamily B, bacterial
VGADVPERRIGDLALVRRMLAEARPERGRLLGVALLSALAAPLALLVPLPFQVTIDHVLGGRPLPPWLAGLLPDAWEGPGPLLWAMAGLTVLAAVLVQLQQMAAWYARTLVGERLVLGLRARLFGHLQRLSLAFHDQGGTAASVHEVQTGAASIEVVVVQGLLRTTTTLFTVLVLVVVTARIDGPLTLVALLGAPALLLLTQVFRNRLRSGWKEAHEAVGRAMAVVQESLAAVRVVKAFGQEERERRRYVERARASQEAVLKAVGAHGGFDLLVGVVVGIVGAVVLVVGAQRVLAGAITLGEMVLVLGYLAQLFGPLRELGTKAADLQRAFAAGSRCFALLDQAPEAPEAPDARPLERARGEVAFEQVGFAYDPARPVLEKVTFHVPAGTRVGIRGPTGSGKSTLLALLFRFLEPQSGRVLLDGVDVRSWRLKDLREQFAFVLQESVLFATTVAENIAYGRPEATPPEIEAAARAAGAHDFIQRLPQGYDTVVGERGATLSGGERQRVALARAFLKDAPILILDEPTSALDVATEASVLEALERLMVGRTTFMIAHRLATLASCDLQLHLADGRVTVEGRGPSWTLGGGSGSPGA